MPKTELRTRDGKHLFTANITPAPSHLNNMGQMLESALQNGVQFCNLDIGFQTLRHITLDGGVFRNVRFFECDFTGANLSECQFENCELAFCDFTDACLCYSDFASCEFRHNVYADADLSEAKFTDCNFAGPVYRPARCAGSLHLEQCHFQQPLV